MFLNRIVTQTRADLEQRKRELPLEAVQRLATAQPRPRNLLAALQHEQKISLIAEVKRASPSRGLLAPHLNPVKLARSYEANGAAAISVLTEPHFFLGSPDHLTAIKQSVGVPVLRKDFIIDEYQVYESRVWGADAILLICAILDDAQLHHLLDVAYEQRMHCLVEVHSREEAQRAVAAGATIIGVNSRDLVTFQVNPYLMRELRRIIPADHVVVAESGIHSPADARRLARYDIQAMLVGESLVVSHAVPEQVRSLLWGANESTQVKICGLRTLEHMRAAIDAGADMLGLMFYDPSPRHVQPQQAQALLQAIENGPVASDVVGVFVNRDAAYINEVVQQVGLHIVQLHGDEPPELCHRIIRPVIKALRPQDMADTGKVRAYREVAWRILLDTPTHKWGGSGVTHDWSIAHAAAQAMPILLAGGLTPENIEEAIQQVHPWGVDVSSGVETNGSKDTGKIRAFIERVRAIPMP